MLERGQIEFDKQRLLQEKQHQQQQDTKRQQQLREHQQMVSQQILVQNAAQRHAVTELHAKAEPDRLALELKECAL